MTAEARVPGRPPQFQTEGLWQALKRLDERLDRALKSADAAYAAGAALEPYRGLYTTSEDVSRLLKREPGEPFLAGAVPAEGTPMPESSRFPWLQRQFALDPFDADTLLIALAPEVDSRYERFFGYLHDDVTRRRPSVDLALNLLAASREAKISGRARFAPDAPMLRHGLLHLVADAGAQATLLTHALKADDSLVRFLLGQDGLDARLQSFAAFERETSSGSAVPAAGLVEWAKDGTLRLHLEGAWSDAKAEFVRSLAANAGCRVLTAQLAQAVWGTAQEVEGDVRALAREAQLGGALLYLRGADSLRTAERAGHWAALQSALEGTRVPVVLEGQKPADPSMPFFTPMALGETDFVARREAWLAAARQHATPLDAGMANELASRYRLEPSQIHQAVAGAARTAALASKTAAGNDLAQAARLQVRRDPGGLARRVNAVYQWRDLVLPDDQIEQLQELCQQARYRHVVMGEWGFERRLSIGKGLSALFSGPPGTGKTMAAEVIANDLGLDLFKIDLSQVVSKYIGETEKNIDRLFQDAQASNAILFFDECDALFGKRTTVQDAHDRYANIEIAYLLQKMDEHDGISILATNLRQNLDPAFLRRLSFIVEFPFPGEDSRRDIWNKIWPKQVPRARDLDLEFMARRFKLSGGSVKNIALAAAFLAAAEDKGEGKSEVRTEHLLRAARRELEKTGRSVPRTEFGEYSDKMGAPEGGGAAMIHQVTDSLEAFLTQPGLDPPLRDAAIRFDRPSDPYSLEQTTVNVFLYEIRENLELRNNEPVTRRVAGQSIVEPPPYRLNCMYMVTAWPVGGEDLPKKEHELLGQVLKILAGTPTIPNAFLTPDLQTQEPPLPMVVVQPDGIRNPAEFWAAIGNRIKPSILLSVTVGLKVFDTAAYPSVISSETQLKTMEGVALGAPYFRIGGEVRDAGNAPISGASVQVQGLGRSTLTDKDGKFKIAALPAGTFTLRVTAGAQSKNKTVTVPAPALAEYDVQIP